MTPDASNCDLLEAWRNGDQAAAALLFQRYQARLLALVRSRLSCKLARRVDAEDVVLSAYRSFFLAARDGRTAPTPSDDLWPLLVTFTLRKLAHQARRHRAERRSIDQELADASAWLQTVLSSEPSVEQAAALADDVEQLVAGLEGQDREILVRLLRGEARQAVADELGLHERTIRRALDRIRQQAQRVEGEPWPLQPVSLTSPRPGRASHRLPQAAGNFVYDQLLLQTFLGAGAFSKVYRAQDRATGGTVAIKYLRKDCWDDARAVAAMVREWEILHRLEHPHILRVQGWGTTRSGGLFLVTDFVPGGDLEAWRRERHPSVAEITAAVASVARAVAAAHRQGVWHCDLKPSNVLRHEDGRVILGDFGLARWAQDPGDVPRGGTAGFLCPEQICDAFGPLSPRSDVYGLGGLLYALLTARSPMPGRDLPETLANVLSLRAPTPPSQLRADVPPHLEALVLRCLSKEPSLRPASAEEVAAALSADDS